MVLVQTEVRFICFIRGHRWTNKILGLNGPDYRLCERCGKYKREPWP
jgi:hypothetical protein